MGSQNNQRIKQIQVIGDTGHMGTTMEKQAVKCMTKLIQASCVALRFSLVMSLSPFQSLPAIKGPLV